MTGNSKLKGWVVVRTSDGRVFMKWPNHVITDEDDVFDSYDTVPEADAVLKRLESARCGLGEWGNVSTTWIRDNLDRIEEVLKKHGLWE